mmetsp:Transcript_5267/g.12898  ORF Transcript_5267/g.12898 Transcript_5267/m.12898 type:complete len:231 (-) Transcript_5267:441-1133(-)
MASAWALLIGRARRACHTRRRATCAASWPCQRRARPLVSTALFSCGSSTSSPARPLARGVFSARSRREACPAKWLRIFASERRTSEGMVMTYSFSCSAACHRLTHSPPLPIRRSWAGRSSSCGTGTPAPRGFAARAGRPAGRGHRDLAVPPPCMFPCSARSRRLRQCFATPPRRPEPPPRRRSRCGWGRGVRGGGPSCWRGRGPTRLCGFLKVGSESRSGSDAAAQFLLI